VKKERAQHGESPLCYIYEKKLMLRRLGILLPRHGTSSGFGWRTCPPDMEGICECMD